MRTTRRLRDYAVRLANEVNHGSLWLLLGAWQSIYSAGPRAQQRLENLVCNSDQL